ncbi:MAG: hypothetical protein JO033_23735 [Acidobacteriaceae bacterium]|nr:hypothetical protein [Acidobacteriaceae bacterium]MBV9503324.1 hypothetical protein [Acidobacteriaceae bacterium]
MFKRFGILSLVLAGATLLQPAAMFAEGIYHNGRNATVVVRRDDDRGKTETRRVETRAVRYEKPVYHNQRSDRRAEYCR